MTRTEALREIRRTRFKEAYRGWQERRLTQREAVRLLGCVHLPALRGPLRGRGARRVCRQTLTRCPPPARTLAPLAHNPAGLTRDSSTEQYAMPRAGHEPGSEADAPDHHRAERDAHRDHRTDDAQQLEPLHDLSPAGRAMRRALHPHRATLPARGTAAPGVSIVRRRRSRRSRRSPSGGPASILVRGVSSRRWRTCPRRRPPPPGSLRARAR